MDLTTISLNSFLCTHRQKMVPASLHSFEEAEDSTSASIGSLITQLSPDYAIHELNGKASGDVALLYNGKIVGFYWGELLAIAADHTGKKLSVPLVIEAVKHRPLPDERTLSIAGKRALTSAWNVANAISQNPWP